MKLTTVIKGIFNSLKDDTNRAEYLAAKLRYNTNRSKRTEVCKLHNGEITVVIHNDLAILSQGNSTDIFAAANIESKTIFINDVVMNLPRRMANAIIAHEIGHIVLGHKITEDYGKEAVQGYGYGLQIELEADKYAYEQGHDIHGVLIDLWKSGSAYPCMHMRIKALEKLTGNVK